MANGPNIMFEALGNIICDKSEKIFQKHVNDEEAFKTFSKFMCLRYLTMSSSPAVRNLVLDNYIALERMPEKILYRWLMKNVPKQNNGFIRYIK